MTQARTPEIRFERFEGEWASILMGDAAQIGTGASDLKDADPKGSFPFFVRSDKVEKSNRYLFDGEAILVPGEGRLGEIFHYVNGKFDYHQRVYRISNFDSIDGRYLFYYLQEHLKSHLVKSTVKATVDSIRLPALTGFEVAIPEPPEQIAISAYFCELDALLDAESQKLEKLRALKQTMLTKMFPQGDSRVPEIRFEGFEGEWNSQSLAELISIGSGRDYKHLAPGGVPVYGTGGYMTSVDQWLSVEDAIGIGRKGTIDKPYLLSAPFWTVDTLFYATPIKGVDLYFLLALSRTLPWKRYDESTGVPSLSKEAIYAIRVAAPIPEEQQAIGAYFRELDVLLDAESQKLEKLRHLKSAFLSSMFV